MFFWVLSYRWIDPPRTYLMYYRKQEALISNRAFELIHKQIDYKKLPCHLIFSVIYAEDSDFFKHHGLKIKNLNLAKKSYFNRSKNKKLKGYSTITQQTAKNLFLYPKKSLVRKGLEIPFVLFMELLLSKERILELYLNNIEWGDGIFGIESAANYYFNKSAAFVNPVESALLAVILYNPRRLNPHDLPKKDHQRASWIYEMTRRKLALIKILEKKKQFHE